jgi:hypothetical protein
MHHFRNRDKCDNRGTEIVAASVHGTDLRGIGRRAQPMAASITRVIERVDTPSIRPRRAPG